jgi:hypothetical protein
MHSTETPQQDALKISVLICETFAALLLIVSFLIRLSGVYLDCIRLRKIRLAIRRELKTLELQPSAVLSPQTPDVDDMTEWQSLRTNRDKRAQSAPNPCVNIPIIGNNRAWRTLPPLTWV